MSLPWFYSEMISVIHDSITLDEDTSRHIVQVLRMKPGEQMQLTDGKGSLYSTQIIDDKKKSVKVSVLSRDLFQAPVPRISIAISLIKNSSRFEWFLEKATEVGVTEILPFMGERTEKQQLRMDRMRSIITSAMLQSQQVWLPVLHEPVNFKALLEQSHQPQKFIAHCADDDKKLLNGIVQKNFDAILLIGPEGDFTTSEIRLAAQYKFIPVSLGDTRLRTETAGIVGLTLLKHS